MPCTDSMSTPTHLRIFVAALSRVRAEGEGCHLRARCPSMMLAPPRLPILLREEVLRYSTAHTHRLRSSSHGTLARLDRVPSYQQAETRHIVHRSLPNTEANS